MRPPYREHRSAQPLQVATTTFPAVARAEASHWDLTVRVLVLIDSAFVLGKSSYFKHANPGGCKQVINVPMHPFSN